MTPKMILVAVMIAASATLIILSGLRFSSAMNELAKRLPFQYRDIMKKLAVVATMAAALMQFWTFAILTAVMALASWGDGFYRFSKVRREAGAAQSKS